MSSNSSAEVVVVGAGAAGMFAALEVKRRRPQWRVVVLEAASRPLGKVKISGGGRCNLTHACFEVGPLLENYPRGGKALRQTLGRFLPQQTMEWFQQRGVALKTEADGRVFPQSDSSQSIIDCLLHEAERLGVSLLTRHTVRQLGQTSGGFELHTSQGNFHSQRLLLAPGGSPPALGWLLALGHRPLAPVPSLFTFQIQDARLQGLEGISLTQAGVELVGSSPRIRQRGALLITHWGLSGPVILRTSAWGARALAEHGYRMPLKLDWLPQWSQERLLELLLERKATMPRALPAQASPWPELPRRLWGALASWDKPWGEIPDRELRRTAQELKATLLEIQGKGVFKEEFVMAGGVPLEQVDLKTMESRICPGLFLAGEILDVDGLTGGFNFQHAWSSGYLAGVGMSNFSGPKARVVP